jgi:cob(I)alamin adenosyltransferase
MSIATKTGDAGTTALMYNRRVSKSHPRVEAYGCVDELNAALGMARASAGPDALPLQLLPIQKDLVIVMGELATGPEDMARYQKDGFSSIAPGHTAKLDAWIKEVEDQNVAFRGWATPGGTAQAAALDVARTICRRAERRICGLHEAGELSNPEIIVFLNRLSDLLWLWARWAESHAASSSGAVA